VNFQEDLREKRVLLYFLELLLMSPITLIFNRTIRELVIKANFESQDALYALEKYLHIHKKKHWLVMTGRSFKQRSKPLQGNLGNSKTSFFLIATIPGAILLGFPLWMPAALISLTAVLFFREAFNKSKK